MRLTAFLFALCSPLFATTPNVIFVLSDDLAQGDLGCYGQKIDPNAEGSTAWRSEGTRFTQAYCGTSVCAPSAGFADDRHFTCGTLPDPCEPRTQATKARCRCPRARYTVAQVLQETPVTPPPACGKWGMGMFDTTGSPLKMGFDHFFGYNCQRHAHSYFPTYPLPG